ncbi:MAG: aminoacyl-tRNA hydrolase [Clostridia bacterium]|nr:aminoacyl-tRNA hydrolase [Clostridia bacterium]
MLIVGLGNPDDKYTGTRHNVGFAAADKLLGELGRKADKVQCKAKVCETYVRGVKTVIAKPLTYMNLSGESVRALLDRYNFTPDQAIIVYDDIDLPVGAWRYRDSGSAGTHNGMRSVIACVGRTDIPRLRIGVGVDKSVPLADYVLSKIPAEEKPAIDEAVSNAVRLIIDKLNQAD